MDWYYCLLITIIPGWWLWLLIHECSHLLFAKVFYNYKPLGIWPYPHWINYDNGEYTVWKFGKEGNWKFYFARCSYDRPDVFPPKELFCIAPMYAGLFFIATCFVSLGVFSFLFWWLVAFIILGVGEVIRFWYTYFWGSKTTDGKRWRYGDQGQV